MEVLHITRFNNDITFRKQCPVNVNNTQNILSLVFMGIFFNRKWFHFTVRSVSTVE